MLLVGLIVVAAIVAHHGGKLSRARRELQAKRLTEEQRAEVRRLFPLWEVIPEDIRMDTEGWMHVFLSEKSFEPCGGLDEVTEEMLLAIAAPACLLIARRPQDYYGTLRSILVYPDAYTADIQEGGESVRLGESWGTGSVVLAWKSVKQGDRDPKDGHNVVLHEFAHQLDQEDGAADGVPEFEEVESYKRWSEAFLPAYREFCERVSQGKRSVLDDYGATNPAEFFAVATETFFEKAEGLKEEEPEIFAELVKFYGMDPSGWVR